MFLSCFLALITIALVVDKLPHLFAVKLLSPVLEKTIQVSHHLFDA